MNKYIEDLCEAYKNDAEYSEDKLKYASNIYKAIKEDEKTRQTWCDKNEQPELFWAKYDLKRLGIDTKGFTKNQIYLRHQSEIINAIFQIVRDF